MATLAYIKFEGANGEIGEDGKGEKFNCMRANVKWWRGGADCKGTIIESGKC